MKRFVVLTIMAVIAGIFVAGQGLGAEDQMDTSSQQGTNQEMNQTNQSGTAQQMQETTQQKTAAMQLNRKQIREMQNLLNQNGYNTGQADGIIGNQTRNALRQYQQSQGLTATGQPNRETLRSLAPNMQQQQFFGLSPAYGEKGQHQMEQHRMEHQQMNQNRMQRNQMSPKGNQ